MGNVLLRMKPKPELIVTPIFYAWTLVMGFAFMYSFTLEASGVEFAGTLKIFQGLYIMGFILMFLNVTLKDDYDVSYHEAGEILLWTFIGVLGIGFTNIIISVWAKSVGMMAVDQMVLNYGVFTDLAIALLAGYNEEIAFAALYFAIYRFVPDKRIGKGRLSISLAHAVTLWATAMLFPLYHILAYNIWGPVFVVLFIGRIVLQEVLIQGKYIEAAIGAHAIWDIITVLPLLFT